jgi:MFS family permease
MLTGALADRGDRRRLMIWSDIGRFAVVALLGVALWADVANIWMLYACAFFLGVGETLHVNAAQVLVPAIVADADLMQANARFGAAQIAATQFVGPPLGVVAFHAGMSVPYLADALTFAGSAALVQTTPDVHGVEAPRTRLRDDIREGFGFLWHTPSLRRMTELLSIINFVYFAAISLLVLYVEELLDAGTFVFTVMFVGAATGTVLSRFVVTRISDRFGEITTMVVAVWFWAVAIVGMSVTSSPTVAVASYSLLGVGTGLWWAVNTTVRQRLTPARLRGRVNAAYRTVSWGVVPFGAAFGGLAAKWWGLRSPFVIAGVAMVLVAFASGRMLRAVGVALAAERSPEA